jgi:hypothetical protein
LPDEHEHEHERRRRKNARDRCNSGGAAGRLGSRRTGEVAPGERIRLLADLRSDPATGNVVRGYVDAAIAT